jgi:tartrate dehydratase beta subunit/fumarate hydratase class I family protein
MAIPLSAPLSEEAVAELRAGDTVALTGPILVLDLRLTTPEAPIESWFAVSDVAGNGWVCCLALAPAGNGSRCDWSVARIDEPETDRVACAVLAAGSRGLVCRGRCLATTSYALRKYGGVCFGAAEHWPELQEVALPPRMPHRGTASLITIQTAHLVVTHDAHGRQVATDD